MTLIESFALGLMQGVTEFLPISSSGHLLLAEHFLGLSVDELKSFDVILHAGTLVALLFLFWREWRSIFNFQFSIFNAAKRKAHPGGLLLAMLVVATLPAVGIGFFFSDQIDAVSRGGFAVLFVALAFLVTGLFIFLAERLATTRDRVSWRDVFLMGLAQALALLPGVSRSGLTMIAGMSSGLSRHAATRFSFLMLTPVVTAAVVYIGARITLDGLAWPGFVPSIIGFAVSAVVSYFFAALFLDFVKKFSLRIFAWYLVLLGSGLLLWQLLAVEISL